MTKLKFRIRKRHSLYLGLLFNIILAIIVAGAAYFVVRMVSGYYVSNVYLSEEKKNERREEYLDDLQRFASKNGISSENTDRIAEWSMQNPYVYLLVYKDEQLFFSSDMGDGGNDGGASDGTGLGNLGALGGIDTGVNGPDVDIDALIKEAEENGMHPIELSDGIVVAELADFTEQLYYDIFNLVAFVVAAILLSLVLINYFRIIIARINRLESDVNIVSHINMNHSILCEGSDEISALSRNVENMRISILDNLKKEREARNANTELITSMSHDIRTPLTVLLGYIDMMKSNTSCDSAMQSYVKASEKTAMRLKELSDDIFKYSLAFGDAEKGIKLGEYNAKMLFEQLISEHALLLEENGYEVSLNNNAANIDDSETVRTDPQNLMRIVDNIFSNLYKYADKSEPIIISGKRVKNLYTVYCRNKISDRTEGVESNGIGLKTCERLAEFVAEDFSIVNDGRYFTVGITFVLSGAKKALPRGDDAEKKGADKK